MNAATLPRPDRLCWLWPVEHGAGLGAEIAALVSTASPLVAGRRFLLVAAVAGIVPVLACWPLRTDIHQIATAAILFPAFLGLVQQDRPRAAAAAVLVTLASHSAIAIALARYAPTSAADLLPGGTAYWEKNDRWIRTGVDPEYQVLNWLPAHAQEAAGMAVYAYTSLGAIPLWHGLQEIDMMNFYVGRLLAVSRSPLLALLLGWHAWAIVRGIAMTRIAFEVASASLERLTGATLVAPLRRRRRLFVGIGLLGVDALLKWLFLDAVRLGLHGNLAG